MAISVPQQFSPLVGCLDYNEKVLDAFPVTWSGPRKRGGRKASMDVLVPNHRVDKCLPPGLKSPSRASRPRTTLVLYHSGDRRCGD